MEKENERRVKKQRAQEAIDERDRGKATAGKLVFSGDKNVNLKIRR